MAIRITSGALAQGHPVLRPALTALSVAAIIATNTAISVAILSTAVRRSTGAAVKATEFGSIAAVGTSGLGPLFQPRVPTPDPVGVDKQR